MHSRCSALLSLSLILPGRRRTPNLQTYCLRALPAGASRYAPAVSSTAGHPRRSCMPCKMSCTFLAQLALSGGLLWLVQVVPLATWSLACINFVVVLLLCSSPDSTKLLLASQPVLGVIASNNLSCLTVFRRLFLAHYHNLLIMGFSAIPAPFTTLWALARATITLLNLFGYRVSALRLFSSSQPLYALLTCALRNLGSPRFRASSRPSRSSSFKFPSYLA